MWKCRYQKYLPKTFAEQNTQPTFEHLTDIGPSITIEECIGYLVRDHPAVAPEYGIIHIGAHRCEEKSFYKETLHIDNILWIDGNDELCMQYPEIVNAVVADEDGKEVEFIITSNDAMSSSILEMEEHVKEHPDCIEVSRVRKSTVRLDTLIETSESIKSKLYDMLVMDVQGAELLVLKGAQKTLENVRIIIAEVNIKPLYHGCPMMSELDEYLSDFGFVRYGVCMTKHGWGDAIYVRKCITVRVHSGLGNRLFQLAFLWAFAKANKYIPLLYDNAIEDCRMHVEDAEKYAMFYDMFERYEYKPRWNFTQVITQDPASPAVYTDFTDIVKRSQKLLFEFQGYFQSEMYFGSYADEIRERFNKILTTHMRHIEPLPMYDSFIHVRGRDHVTPSNVAHNIPTIHTYYEKAVTQSKCDVASTVVITDDIKYCESIPVLSGFHILDPRYDELTSLYVMTQCTHMAITPNSTFSWWGAYLARPQQTYMPFPYLLNGMSFQDIYPRGVTKINATVSNISYEIFDDITTSIRHGDCVTIILVRKGSLDPWILDRDILVNGRVVDRVTHITQEDHQDNYNDVCIIQTQIGSSSSDDETSVLLTINCVEKMVKLHVIDIIDHKRTLVAMTMFKNDEHLIGDYLKHYRKLGIQHFYMYYNGDKLLTQLPAYDDVTYFKWPYPYIIDKKHYAQIAAMTDVIHRVRHSTQYILFNDLDEYLLWKPKHVDLLSFITSNGFDIYGFLNNFILLQDNTHIGSQIDDGLYTKTYEWRFGVRSKCIIRPDVFDVMGIHKPIDKSHDTSMCVLAGPTCELLHVCNFSNRKHVSITPLGIQETIRFAKMLP